jgi:hypothetical protein
MDRIGVDGWPRWSVGVVVVAVEWVYGGQRRCDFRCGVRLWTSVDSGHGGWM